MDAHVVRIAVCAVSAIAIISLGGLILIEALGRSEPPALVCALQVSIGFLTGLIVPTRNGWRADGASRFEVAPPPIPPAKV